MLAYAFMTFSIMQLFANAVSDEMIYFASARKNFHVIWSSFLALLRFFLLPAMMLLCLFLIMRFDRVEGNFELSRYVVYMILGHFLEEIEEYEKGEFFTFSIFAFLITVWLMNLLIAVMTD